jgi:hypothetical protein
MGIETWHCGWATRSAALGLCRALREEGSTWPAGPTMEFQPRAKKEIEKGFSIFQTFSIKKLI